MHAVVERISSFDAEMADADRALQARLWQVLKSFDRIGFGRLGVLDAEQEIRQMAARLDVSEAQPFADIVLGWLEIAVAERIAAKLQYNLPEHVQVLALRLCASVPITQSLPLLRRLQTEQVFTVDNEMCNEALDDAIKRLQQLI